jgi:transcriptional regulator with XRE-family HTH domain
MNTHDAERRAEAFGLAVARHLTRRGDQTRLGEALDLKPSTLSGYVNGKRIPPVEVAAAMERHLDLDPGTLTVHLGYLPLEAGEVNITSTEEAIIADGRLTGSQKSHMLWLFGELVGTREQSERLPR